MTSMRQGREDQLGLTLIEVLVAVATFALLVVMVDAVFSSAHRISQKAELGADVQQNARIAVERFTREIREASFLTIQFAGSSTARHVVFQSARASDSSTAFCVDVGPGDSQRAALEAACTINALPVTGTYAPVWQRYIGYYLDTSRGIPGVLRRRASNSPLTPPLVPGDDPIVAGFVQSFDVNQTGQVLTVSLKAFGEKTVEGSFVPPQEFLINGTVLIRN